MTNVDPDRDKARQDVIQAAEFEAMLKAAAQYPYEFLSFRNPAILCVFRLSGKRRGELDQLPRANVWRRDKFLRIRFKLLKKRRAAEVVKSIPINDPYLKPVLEYTGYLTHYFPNATYYFPVCRAPFGNYSVDQFTGLKERAIYNVVREAADKAGVVAWPHLFRETAGAEEVIKDPSLYGVYKVMNRLNITERAAWAYMARHALNVIKRPNVDS
jgi:site-specific recombinase XerD